MQICTEIQVQIVCNKIAAGLQAPTHIYVYIYKIKVVQLIKFKINSLNIIIAQPSSTQY